MPRTKLEDKILQTALSMAERQAWEAIHLHEIAAKLGISLDQIRSYYPQKDDLVEAWFDRADHAVLDNIPTEEFLQLTDIERLHRIMMTWFETLARYRRVTRDMLRYKLEFGHIHLQVLGIMRISRTVQWFREAAQQNSTDLIRILEEVGTTGIFLMSFSRWLYDDSPGFQTTRSFLDTLLQQAEKCAQVLPK